MLGGQNFPVMGRGEDSTENVWKIRFRRFSIAVLTAQTDVPAFSVSTSVATFFPVIFEIPYGTVLKPKVCFVSIWCEETSEWLINY